MISASYNITNDSRKKSILKNLTQNALYLSEYLSYRNETNINHTAILYPIYLYLQSFCALKSHCFDICVWNEKLKKSKKIKVHDQRENF